MFGPIIDALIGILCGGYCLLAASGKVDVSKDPEQAALWRKKYGTIATACGIIVLLGGIISAIRIFI